MAWIEVLETFLYISNLDLTFFSVAINYFLIVLELINIGY